MSKLSKALYYICSSLAETRISHLEDRRKQSLVNSNFSIITGSCIGGVIYHKLGMRFMSPTINMWMTPTDVLKFCQDIDYYVSAELIFGATPHKDCPNSPTAYLGYDEKQIVLYFNHSNSEIEAANDWNRRKNRINKDNLYIIITDYGLSKSDIETIKLIKCKRTVVFTAKKRFDIPNSFRLSGLRNEVDGDLHMVKKGWITGRSVWEQEFDYVKWLNGCKSYRYMSCIPYIDWIYDFLKFRN